MAGSSKPPQQSGQFKLVKSHKAFEGLEVFEFHHLDNGLKVFLSPKKGSNSIAYVTGYDVGSRFEEKGRTGLAHLFEHMMFRGTETFPEPFKTLSEWGGQYNAYTSRDMTVYYQIVPNKLLNQVAQLESERMRKLLITKAGFNTERGAVVSERKKSVSDNPFGKLWWELYQLAFDKHSYKTGPIGWQKDLDATSFEDALLFYKRFYAPNRAIISIVGDFEINNALETLNKYYGAFKAQDVKIPNIPIEKTERPARRKVVSLKAEKVIMADARFSPSSSSPHAASELLLCVLLAGGDSGYLNYELVETGLAQSVSSSCYPSIETGLSSIFVVANPGKSIKEIEKAYDSSWKGFPDWLTDERIESIKLYFTLEQLSALRDPTNLAKDFVSSAILSRGDPLYSFKLMDAVKQLKRKDILDRLSQWKSIGKTRVFIQPRS